MVNRFANRQFIVNNPSRYPISFYDNAGVASTAALGTTMSVVGLGDFKLSDLGNVKGFRGVEGQRQLHTLTAGANFNLTGAIPQNESIKVVIDFYTRGSEAGLERRNSYHGRVNPIEITVNTGETPQRFLGKLWYILNSQANKNYGEYVRVPSSSVVTGGPYNATNINDYNNVAMDVLTLEAVEFEYVFSLKFLRGDSTVLTNVVTPYVTYTSAIAPDYFYGRGNYDQLKNVFVDTDWRAPYHIDRESIPYEQNLYTTISFTHFARYEGKQGGGDLFNLSNRYTERGYDLYLNEATTALMRTDLVTFLDRATILSTANPAFDAPLWYSNAVVLTPVAAGAF